MKATRGAMVADATIIGEGALTMIVFRIIATLVVAGPVPFSRMRRAKSLHAGAHGGRR